jgi:hypothetical protein
MTYKYQQPALIPVGFEIQFTNPISTIALNTVLNLNTNAISNSNTISFSLPTAEEKLESVCVIRGLAHGKTKFNSN